MRAPLLPPVSAEPVPFDEVAAGAGRRRLSRAWRASRADRCQ